jgi:porin
MLAWVCASVGAATGPWLCPSVGAARADTLPPQQGVPRDRTQATGDWWGARSELSRRGLNLRLWATGYEQGQLNGDVGGLTPSEGPGAEFLSGGRLDALIDLNTTQAGLWRGGGFHAHLEIEGGQDPGFRGGAFWPVNAAAILPLGSAEQLVATSLYYSQSWGGTSLMLGKINMIDLLAADPFFGGWGIDRFMNLAFVAPPAAWCRR